MANRIFYPLNGRNVGTVHVGGSFDTNGGSSPASPLGGGFTVARTGTGTYTLTLTDSYYRLVGFGLTAQCNSAGGFQVDMGAADVTTARTIVIRTLVAGVAADVAANANNRVHFNLFLKNSSALP